ncbi:hypothetical protein ACMFGU_07690 [Morganella morganii]|uniref:hypothetical protein n=1 Tax=Morganella morganii TaxID=582 RepID=UPI0022A26A7D|nr:hypothetical protein [Morganella morganii]
MLSLPESNHAQLIAMHQVISIIISLLPEDKKEQAKSIIKALSEQNYADKVNDIPTLTDEQATAIFNEINKTYSDILASIEVFGPITE